MKTIDFSSVLSACLAVALPIAMAEQYDGGANYGYSSSIYGGNAYADSSSTYYNGYAQAWRYLGWYVDCNGGSSRYYSQSGGGGGSHSGDQSSSFGNNYCQRYLMWAAVSSVHQSNT